MATTTLPLTPKKMKFMDCGFELWFEIMNKPINSDGNKKEGVDLGRNQLGGKQRRGKRRERVGEGQRDQERTGKRRWGSEKRSKNARELTDWFLFFLLF